MSHAALSVRHLRAIEELTLADAQLILSTAQSFTEVNSRQLKKVPALRGRTVALLFFENSTRTRLSFELAAKRLSADTLSFSAATSSTQKGETLQDTVRNIEAMGPDIVVVRHEASGAAHALSRVMSGAIVNAGDGQHEHPTQAGARRQDRRHRRRHCALARRAQQHAAVEDARRTRFRVRSADDAAGRAARRVRRRRV
jgi:aspartate carbamoyltransferase catalytic subunit